MRHWNQYNGPKHILGKNYKRVKRGRKPTKRRRNEIDQRRDPRPEDVQSTSSQPLAKAKRVFKCSICGLTGHTKKSFAFHDMSRRTHSEAMHDVPSPSHGNDTVLPDLSRIEDPGPIVRTHLYKQPTHRSMRIWETSSTSLLVVRHRGHWVADERILPYVVRAGLAPWYYMQNYEVDWSFMTTLVERWRSETHTFHLRHGEMTITLEDVGVLTGLPIEGKAVITNLEGQYEGDSGGCFRGGYTEIRESVYILVMLGSSLFLDSSGNDVSLHYLPLLADLDAISEYSWSSAALAFLYRSLCNACESTHTQLSGCAILIQLWAWEHLIIGRSRRLAIPAPPPGSDVDPMRVPALGYKWTVPKSWMQTSHYVLMLYRDLLDRQEANDVIWTPYTKEVLGILNPMCVAGRAGASIATTKSQMHMSKRRTSDPLGQDMQVYMNLWDNRVESIITGELDTDGLYLDAYYTWYYDVTRKRIQPPLETPVTSLVRTCKVSSGVFLKTTDHDSKRALHDLFHSTRADLLRIGEGLALDVDPAQIHLHDDSDEDVDLPEDNYEVGGPSQVTQAETQMTPVRRVSSRARSFCGWDSGGLDKAVIL
ncbi:hypothetical protein QQ045_012730 [Rhodiola kirilowii]